MGELPRTGREARIRLIVRDDSRMNPFIGRSLWLLWTFCAGSLFMGTVSSLLGAHMAPHSVVVPPLGELSLTERDSPEPLLLPSFRAGLDAEVYLSESSPAAPENPPPASTDPEPAQRDQSAEEDDAEEQQQEQHNIFAPPLAPAPELPANRPGTFVIRRSVVDAVANAPSSVGAQSTHVAVEHNEAGTPIGLRITGVSRDSALRLAGIRNGDVLLAVNGETVNSPQRGVAMYQRLSTSSGVSVELLRRGQRHRIRIEVSDDVDEFGTPGTPQEQPTETVLGEASSR